MRLEWRKMESLRIHEKSGLSDETIDKCAEKLTGHVRIVSRKMSS